MVAMEQGKGLVVGGSVLVIGFLSCNCIALP